MMQPAFSSPATPQLKRWSRYFTVCAFGIGLFALIGWMTESDFLMRLMPDAVAINPLSAICFLLCAGSLWIQRDGTAQGKRLRNARWAALLVASIGLAKLISVIFRFDFVLDSLLFPDHINDEERNILNTMSPNSAVGFFCIGLALFWIDRETAGRRRPAQYLSILIMFLAILSLYGYVYGVKYLYGIYSFKPMSIISALDFLLLAVAVLFARPEKGTMAIIIGDTSAEITLLRLAAFIIPLVMGWLKLKGEQKGYYNTEFGTALFAIVTYALAMFLLARRSVVNYKMRAMKREAQEELQKAHDRFLKFFNLSPEAKLITTEDEGRILYMNKAFEELMHIEAADAIGRTTTEMDIISLDERARVVESIRSAGLNRGIELKLKAGNGEMKDILISLERIELDDRSCFLTNYLDITSRKKLEDALRESEQLLRAILDNMGEGVEVVDAKGRFLLTNPMAEQLVGHRSPEDTSGEWIRNGVFYPDGKTPYPSEELALHRALQGQDVDNLEFTVQSNGSPPRIIRSSSRPIRDGRGQVIAGVSVMNDITRRKQMEQQLRSSEERMRMIINTSLDAFVGMDDKGTITDWNRQAEITFGWSREEAVGRLLADTIIPEKHRQSHQAGLQHYLATGEGPVLNKRIEIEAWHRHGYVFPIEMTITALRVGDEHMFCAFAHDITARRKHVEEIHRTSHFLNTILENIPDMIFVKDAEELRFVKFNKAGEDLLGYSRDDLMGKNDYDFFPKEQADFFTAKDREVLDKKVPVDIAEEPIDTAKGRRWLHTKKITLTDENGRPTYLMGISEDITGRKLMQDELKKNEFLLRAIVDTMDEGVVVCNKEGEFLVFNEMAALLLGHRPSGGLEEELGQTEIFYPDTTTSFPAEETALKRALRGEQTEGLELFVRNSRIPEGIFILSSGRPITDRDGQLVAGVTMFRDISSRRRLQRMLLESEEQLKAVIRSVGDGLVLCDAEGRLLHFNDKAHEILGQGPLNILPSEWSERYHVFRVDGSPFPSAELPLAKALQGQSSEGVEACIRPPQGRERNIVIAARPVADPSGRIAGAVASFRDITEVRAMENLLREVQGRYHELVSHPKGKAHKKE